MVCGNLGLMGYRKMNGDQLYEIYRRAAANYSVSGIAANARWDRKTIRKYVSAFSELGITRNEQLLSKPAFLEVARHLIEESEPPPGPARSALDPHEEELRQLIEKKPKSERMKPKTAFESIRRKYGLEVSYETFKRFARQRGLGKPERVATIRIELPPGQETQLDYGKVGTGPFREGGANGVVYAFCAVLSFSRYPYFEFVLSQDQQSFTGSFVRMLCFYGGATERVVVDNLKSAVIRVDLWDPQLNRAFAEAAEYYGVFIDPARAGMATDKGKVERLVPTARELYRQLRFLHPSATLSELNRHALEYVRSEIAEKIHGTTKRRPAEAFAVERGKLRALPSEPFEAPRWKQVKVHPGDQFFTFDGKRFSLPRVYRGHSVMVRAVERFLEVFDNKHQRIRCYPLVPGQRLYYIEEDFPVGARQMMDGGYPAYLLEQAKGYGPEAQTFIAKVLTPHAYLNARRAQGLLKIINEFYPQNPEHLAEMCRLAFRRGITLPSTFRALFSSASPEPQASQSNGCPRVDPAMVRDINYYFEL